MDFPSPLLVSRVHRIDRLDSGLLSAQLDARSGVEAHCTRGVDGATLSFDLPGVRPEDIEVDPQADRVVISATREGVLHRHVVRLAAGIDPAAITADLDHGVLEVRVLGAIEEHYRTPAIRRAVSPATVDDAQRYAGPYRCA